MSALVTLSSNHDVFSHQPLAWKLLYCFLNILMYSYSSSSTYPGPGRGGSRLSRDTQTFLKRSSPQTPPPAPPGGAQGVPRPAERHSPSSVSWAVPWASSRWDVPGTPPEEGVQEASGLDAR
ncbi:hypothetical protein XENOCAPTIV_018997, partial [Xenoophorus captivus]